MGALFLRAVRGWMIGVTAMLSAAVGAQPDEKAATLEEQLGVAVTIYNEDLALIKDRRRVTLDQGEGMLAFREVSARMQPQTAQLRSLGSAAGVRVVEQYFDFDLLTPQSLLDKYVGRQIGIVKVHPTSGEESIAHGTVLSTHQGLVMRIGERIETGLSGRIVFPDLPPNFRERPTLVMKLHNDVVGPQEVELSYLTQGLSWKADYVAQLSADETALELNGWITLTNASGTGYRQAQLQLVAGDVHRASPEPAALDQVAMERTAMAAGEASPITEKFAEYHLYTPKYPTTIADKQTKQVALMEAQSVPVRKELALLGDAHHYVNEIPGPSENLPIGVFLEFKNDATSHLGLPLPKGVIRVYKDDVTGSVQFIGEDHIPHTPKGENVRLQLGNAFDLTAQRKQTEFKKVQGQSQYEYAYESAFEILLTNAKAEAAIVWVQESIPGQWSILDESSPHTKVTAGLVVWKMVVPPEGHATLSYRVQVTQ